MFRPGQQNQTGQGSQNQRNQVDEPQISNIGPLPFPLEAIIDETGESVTLLQTCDWEGNSPSNIGIDRNGKQFIASFAETTVVDHRALPNQQAQQIRQQRRQQTQLT